MDPNEKVNPAPKGNPLAGFKVKRDADLVSTTGRLVGVDSQMHWHPKIGARSHGTEPVQYPGTNPRTGKKEMMSAPVITPEEIKSLLEHSAAYAKFFDYPEGFTPGKKA